jgi:hypothetical protein
VSHWTLACKQRANGLYEFLAIYHVTLELGRLHSGLDLSLIA